MKRPWLLALGCAVLPATGSAQTPPARDSVRLEEVRLPTDAQFAALTDSIRGLDPAKDAARAWRNGEHRFWAIMGYAIYVPGVPPAQVIYSSKRSNFRVMQWTSDNIGSDAQGDWISAAVAYARSYNAALLRLAATR